MIRSKNSAQSWSSNTAAIKSSSIKRNSRIRCKSSSCFRSKSSSCCVFLSDIGSPAFCLLIQDNSIINPHFLQENVSNAHKEVIPIPCPHFKISIVKRSQGQSAVAGAAYQSGERLFSEYDQKTKFYNRKNASMPRSCCRPMRRPDMQTVPRSGTQ